MPVILLYSYCLFNVLASSTDIVKTKAILLRKWSPAGSTAHGCCASNWQNSRERWCSRCRLYDFSRTQGLWVWFCHACCKLYPSVVDLWHEHVHDQQLTDVTVEMW